MSKNPAASKAYVGRTDIIECQHVAVVDGYCPAPVTENGAGKIAGRFYRFYRCERRHRFALRVGEGGRELPSVSGEPDQPSRASGEPDQPSEGRRRTAQQDTVTSWVVMPVPSATVEWGAFRPGRV